MAEKSGTIKVLLVEDNPGDARLIEEMLTEAKGASFKLESAQSLSEGLARLAKGGLDVILLDLFLPDSAGVDTLVKMSTQAPEVPIIALTGLMDEGVAGVALQRTAKAYLIKGQIDGNSLVSTIHKAIQG